MDKILSARVDESVTYQIDELARTLGRSKKSIIEKAIQAYAKAMGMELGGYVFEQTCGAWRRRESAEELREKSRRTFERSMRRHQS